MSSHFYTALGFRHASFREGSCSYGRHVNIDEVKPSYILTMYSGQPNVNKAIFRTVNMPPQRVWKSLINK